MKTSLLFSLVLFFVYFKSNAQCTTAVSGFGNNSSIASYNVSGSVNVTLNTNNTVTLNLSSNFMTAAGPDIRAYLVRSNGLTNAQINAAVHNQSINNVPHIVFGIVGAIGSINQNGAKTFTVPVPAGVAIENYDKILFYCLQFNQFWDIGSFQSFTPANCSVLGVEDNILQKISIHPNPVQDYLQIEGNTSDTIEIQIVNMLGKSVFNQKGLINDRIDVSNIETGVYIINIFDNEKTFSKKLIKK